jgi:hypothetical protein
MKIKFFATDLCYEIVKNFKNDTIKLNIMTKDTQDVDFLILNRDTNKC